jgi:N-sulfoglucosamine sulfohydrolase
LPLVKKYIDNGGSQKGKYGISILARIAQVQDW